MVILTDEEAKARAARLRRDHDQLEMLLDRAEKYINQVNLSHYLPSTYCFLRSLKQNQQKT